MYGHKLKIVSFFIPYVQTGINYLLFILTIAVLTKGLNRDKFLALKKEQNNKIYQRAMWVIGCAVIISYTDESLKEK